MYYNTGGNGLKNTGLHSQKSDSPRAPRKYIKLELSYFKQGDIKKMQSEHVQNCI